MCLLALRRYAEAWPLYEARREIQGTLDPDVDYPEWGGEPLAGRRIVVVAEQGLGDQLMFGRHLRILEAQGAEVVAACDPRPSGPPLRAPRVCDHALPAGGTGASPGGLLGLQLLPAARSGASRRRPAGL